MNKAYDYRTADYVGEASEELTERSKAAAPAGVVLAEQDEHGVWQPARPGRTGRAVWVET